MEQKQLAALHKLGAGAKAPTLSIKGDCVSVPLPYRHILSQGRGKCKYVHCNFGYCGPI